MHSKSPTLNEWLHRLLWVDTDNRHILSKISRWFLQPLRDTMEEYNGLSVPRYTAYPVIRCVEARPSASPFHSTSDERCRSRRTRWDRCWVCPVDEGCSSRGIAEFAGRTRIGNMAFLDRSAGQMGPEPIMNEWPVNSPEGEAWGATNRRNTSL